MSRIADIEGTMFIAIWRRGAWHPASVELASGNMVVLISGYELEDDATEHAEKFFAQHKYIQ